MALSPLIPLFGGLGTGLLGGIFGGSAADMARKRLIAAANTPGLDVGALTSESIRTSLGAIPRATKLTSEIGAVNARQLAEALERAIPGYGSMVGAATGRVQDYLSGALPADVSQAVMRATAGTALGAGYGLGTPLHRALTWRDLGKTSEEGIRYGLGTLMQMPRALPYAQPANVAAYIGPSPLELIALRNAEQQMRLNLLAQAAGMPGQTGIWGNMLGQLGGLGMGYGLYGLMYPGTQTRT